MQNDTIYKFYHLEGCWKITRTLGQHGTATGIAKISKGSDIYELLYTEKLDVQFHHQELIKGAHQEYKFLYDSARQVITKFTSRGEKMYDLDFFGSTAEGTYICNSDKYVATYFFFEDNKFILTYDVQKTNQEYLITTQFEKIVAGNIEEESRE